MHFRLRKYLTTFQALPIRQPLFFVSAAFSILVLALILALLLWRLRPIVEGRDLIPLHYNVYVGVDRVGAWTRLLWIPGFGALVFFFNFLSASWWYGQEKMLATFFVVGTPLVELVLLVATLLILLVNL